MPQTMQALCMRGFGEPEDLRIEQISVPRIGPHDVLVRVAAVALNPVDWKEVAGMLAAFYPPYPSPWVPGFDGSGVVEQVGAEVKDVAPGDRVLIRPDRAQGLGPLAEFACVARDKVALAPPGLTHPQIACIATALRTAWQAFARPDIGQLRAGDSIVIDGASGGVGGYAVTLARKIGARVAGTCRPENATYLRTLGAEECFDYRDPALMAQVREWAPEGVNVVFDCNGGGRHGKWLELLASGGRMISLATLTNDGDIAAMSSAAAAAGKHFHFLLMDYDRLAEDMAGLAPILAKPLLPLPATVIYPFDRAVEAMIAVKAGGIRGKVVVQISRLD